MPATLGYVIATPSELPRVLTNHNGLTIHDPWVRTIHNGLTTHDAWVHTIHNGLTIHDPGVCTIQHRSPIPTFPKGKEPFKPPKTQQVGTPAPWGGLGRGSLWTPAPWGGPGRGLHLRGGASSYNLSHTRRKPQQVAMSGRHWLRVITPHSESELLWFPPRMTLQLPVCGPLGLV